MEISILLECLRQNYGLSQDLSLELMQESDYNSNYRVRSGDKSYFLKVGKILEATSVAEESSILRHLADQGFPVPALIPNLSGEFISYPASAKTLMLYDFLLGRLLITTKEVRPSQEETSSGAEALARLHQITSQGEVWRRASRTALTEIDRALSFQDSLRRFLSDADVLIKELKEAQKKFKVLAADFSLVHGDWRSKNLLYQPAGNGILAVFDFEWCFYGPRLYDLGLMLVEWSYPDGGSGFDFDLIATILESYSKASGRSYRLDENLKFWMYYAALCDAATYFVNAALKNNLFQPTKELRSSYMYQKARAVLDL